MRLTINSILVLSFFVMSCGSESQDEVLQIPQQEKSVDSLPILEGEFLFLDGAAVLKGKDFIYGVEIDSLAKELAEKLEPLKSDNFDMVPVVIKAKIISNPRRDGWEKFIQIREILRFPGKISDSAVSPSE